MKIPCWLKMQNVQIHQCLHAPLLLLPFSSISTSICPSNNVQNLNRKISKSSEPHYTIYLVLKIVIWNITSQLVFYFDLTSIKVITNCADTIVERKKDKDVCFFNFDSRRIVKYSPYIWLHHNGHPGVLLCRNRTPIDHTCIFYGKDSVCYCWWGCHVW